MYSEVKSGSGNQTSSVMNVMLSIFKAWLISTSVSLVILTTVSYCFSLEMIYINIGCSAISFIGSASAGRAAQKCRRGGAVFTGLLTGLSVTVALLTMGFMLKGSAMSSSGIISVSSFSLTGSLLGSVFFSENKVHKKGKMRKR